MVSFGPPKTLRHVAAALVLASVTVLSPAQSAENDEHDARQRALLERIATMRCGA